MKRPFPSGIARDRPGSGFTLVELLVVMAIIAIIAAASVTASQGVNSALNLTNASQAIVSEITTARQTSLTYSETVEVRFYLYADSITGTPQYQAIQTFSTRDNSTFIPLDRITYLPVNIMIDHSTGTTSTTALSYPFNEPSATANPSPYTPNGTVNGIATSGAPSVIPSNGVSYTYKYLRFKVGGSIDYLMPGTLPAGWPPSNWYITLYEKKYAATPTAAKNFITVSVDSANGRVRTFQP